MDIDQQYADGISKISTSISAIEMMKGELSVKLAQRVLKINESKTEEYIIKERTVIIVGETGNYLVVGETGNYLVAY